jgi:hypothetical protein
MDHNNMTDRLRVDPDELQDRLDADLDRLDDVKTDEELRDEWTRRIRD